METKAAHLLLENVVLRYGIPKILRSDNGPQCINSVWECLLKTMRLKHHRVIPHHPQSNGIIERENREIMKFMKALINARIMERKNWDKGLPFIRFIMNAQTSSATGYSPFEMVFARRPKEAIDLFPKRLSIDQLKLSNKTAKRESIDFVDNVRETLVAYQEKAIELQEKLRKKRKKNEKESP
ncbi:hypothetical protein ADUPG1_005106, partial [Aduncisulcus paluster]